MSELNNIAGLFTEIKNLIDNSRNKVATVVNAEMTMLYWKIGKRINDEIGTQSRAEGYGKQIVATLWRQLSDEYGALFSEKNLRRMMQFAKVFSDETIVVSLIRQLSWTHIIALIPIEDPLKRDFYIEMCKMDKWSVRTLRGRIDSMLFERTAISKKGEETILQDIEALKNEAKLSPDLVFRDPYFWIFWFARQILRKGFRNSYLGGTARFYHRIGSRFCIFGTSKTDYN